MLLKKQIFVDIICGLFILLFTYAALSKLLDYQKFQVQLGQSPLLSPYASWAAFVVPILELITAVALASSRFRLPGLYSAFLLMTIFTNYIIVITRYSDFIPCSCGGVLQNMNWTQHLFFNVGFVLLAIGGVLLLKPQNAKRQIP